MDYETEEQQVEALKAWWNENGRAVVAGVLLGGGVIGGWALWQKSAEKKTVASSDVYSRALEAASQADVDTTLNLADQVQNDNPNHLYAAYTSFAAASAAVGNGDLDEAASRLEWVVKNAPQDDVKLIAQVRLARVMGANGDPSAGLSALPSEFPEAFAGLVEEARGDLHVLAGDEAAARDAYDAASASQYVANREGLTMKINELALPGSEDDADTESTS